MKNIINLLAYIGEFSKEHPAQTMLLIILLICAVIVLTVMAFGLVYYPGAIVIGCLFGAGIGFIFYSLRT